VDLPHLIALELKAGGPRDRNDVMELLLRHEGEDRIAIRAVCERFKVSRRFDRLVADMTALPGPEDD
jgi:hypothetical protein